MSTCDHRWLRLPAVDFSVTYQCENGCEMTIESAIGWLEFAAATMEDVDRAFEAQYGGKVAGLKVPWPGPPAGLPPGDARCCCR